MINPQEPTDEAQRLQVLHQLKLLDQPLPEELACITRLAQQLFKVPIALISLIDQDRQWFVARCGTELSEIPRHLALCAHTLERSQPMIIADALQDNNYSRHPMVTGEPYLRFYAGLALRSQQGHALGTLCLLDNQPRTFSAQDLQSLHDVADLAQQFFHRLEQEQNLISSHQKVMDAYVQQLKASQHGFHLLTQHVPALVAYVDTEVRYKFCNAMYTDWLGYEADTLVGQHLSQVLDEIAYARAEPHIRKALRGLKTQFENEMETLKGHTYVQTSYIPDVQAGVVQGFYVLVFDISDRKALEDQLSYEATHDPLTSLPNRRAFTTQLRGALARRQRADRGLALLFLDLDNFKALNDQHGQQYGDQVLQHLSRTLIAAIRQTDTVARWAGDEFIIALEGLDNPQQDVTLIANKIQDSLQDPALIAKIPTRLTCSMGIAIAEKNQNVSIDQLLSDADSAMYRAKSKGKGRFEIA